ncbi:MAG: anthranilate synthase component I [Ruminococcus sp.]|nr:anthranilate synthase component I [Ruminococcus sp.]
MLYPSVEQVKELLSEYKTVPTFYELLMDSFTPIHLFNALHEAYENCFILESVDNKDQWGRYSYIGIEPKQRITLDNHKAVIENLDGSKRVEDVEDPIKFFSDIIECNRAPKIPNRPKLTGGLIGYFAYDMVRYFEKTLTNVPNDDLKMPDADLYYFDKLVAYDHLSNKAVIILNISAEDNVQEKYAECEKKAQEIVDVLNSYVPKTRGHKEPKNTDIEVRSNITKEQYLKNVEISKEYIRNGDIFQIVPSQRFEVSNPPDSFDVYRMLRATNPSPYLYYFSCSEYAYAGASPEMLVSVNGNTLVNRPIAGTIKRGETYEQDMANERQLINDPKERAEHTMLVDLGRNDVGKVSKFGSVNVSDYMVVERYSKVMHLVSNVVGELADDKKPMDALMAVLPAGTLSGAPKVRAMEIIDELETTKRCLYGGTVGYLAFDGSIDTCIAIRTVLFRNNKAYVQAGGGVVLDSVPENEYMESVNKSMAIINAIKEASAL